MTIRITILGCGNSTGVPSADGGWGTCDPTEPRNRRLRSSILIQKDDTTVLIDAGPDLRQQLLSANVRKLDAVIFTHVHADHSAGVDDLRPFVIYGGSPLPAAQSYQITAIDGQQDLFTLVIRQYLDKAGLNKSHQKKQQLASLDISDYSEYQFIQSTGWIKHLLYKRKIASAAYTQTESFTIDLKD